jgi:hypothetical protein
MTYIKKIIVIICLVLVPLYQFIQRPIIIIILILSFFEPIVSMWIWLAVILPPELYFLYYDLEYSDKNKKLLHFKNEIFLDEIELKVLQKYITFFCYPTFSSNFSMIFSFMQLASIPLCLVLFYHKLYLIGGLILINTGLQAHLSRKLRPLFFVNRSPKNSTLFIESNVLSELYEKIIRNPDLYRK